MYHTRMQRESCLTLTCTVYLYCRRHILINVNQYRYQDMYQHSTNPPLTETQNEVCNGPCS